MRKSIFRTIAIVLTMIFAISGCSFSYNGENGTESSFDEPELKLSSDYTVGNFLYKDGKEYYIHENELVEHKPQTNTFFATTEVDGAQKEFTFQWYEWNGEIKVLNEAETDTYYFEAIEGCTSYSLLVLRDSRHEFGTYKLCDLENNKILPLFEDKLETYSVNDIQLSADLSHAIVSADKGDQLFIYDGETTYPLNELVNGNLEEKSYGARFVGDQILILETEKTGDKETKSAYLFDYKDKSVKKTIDSVSLEEPDMVAQKGKYMYYPKEDVLAITNLVTGTTIDTNISYRDLFYVQILLDEQIVVATNDGKIMLLESDTGKVISEIETGLEMTYSSSGNNYSFSRVESDEGVYVAVYKVGEEILIYQLTS